MSWHSHILAAYIMNARALWNYDALFDYTDRYMAIANGDPGPFGFTVEGEVAGLRTNVIWLEEMWDTYTGVRQS